MLGVLGLRSRLECDCARAGGDFTFDRGLWRTLAFAFRNCENLMFGTIRKHQSWLWMIIITLTIISFVVFFSPTSKIHGGREARLGSINGKEITVEQYSAAARDATLQYFFMSGGRWPDSDARQSGFDVERETYQWMLLMQKAEQFGIHISSDMVVDVARNMLSQFQRSGITTPQQFATQVLEPRGFRLADFERFVRHYLAIQEMVALFGTPGRLVTPEDVRALYIRENQELSAEAVFFSPADYLPKVTVTPEAIAHYYTNHLAEYRLPERAQVKYVEFNLSNYLDMARSELAKTNIDELVNLNMQRLGTNYLRYGTNESEARVRIQEEVVRSRALIEARRKAAEFATVVIETEPVRLANFTLFAQSNNLPVKVTEPFGPNDTPPGLDVPQSFATAAFNLGDSTNNYFGGPVVGDTSVYVIAYDKRIPSEIPPLEQIRDKVTSDFKQEQARGMANAAGRMFHLTLTNAMAKGKSFTEAAKENNFNVVTLPPFALSTRSMPELNGIMAINELKQIAYSTPPGEVSQFQPVSQGGAIVHVKSKLPVDQAKLEAELPRYAESVRQNRQSDAFNEWFRKEASQGLRDTPLMAPRTPPNMAPAAEANS